MIKLGSMVDRSEAPGFVPVKDVNLQETLSYKLNNGVPLHIINAGSQPVINLQFVFKAGKWYEQVPGSSLLLSKLMLEGTHSFTAQEINNYFDSHGIFWEVSSGFDHFTIDVYLLTKYLHKISEIVLSILSEARLPESEFETIKARLKQQLSVNHDKTSYVAGSIFRKNIFGDNHAYGYFLTPELIDSVSYDQVRMLYDLRIKNTAFELIVSGAINQKVADQISEEFGKVNLEETSEPDLQMPIKSARGQIYEDWESSVQTSLRIGRLVPKKNSKDALKLEVMNKVLGGYFGSRLMRNLREEKGLTYGIHSSIAYLKNGSYYIISTDVIKEKKDLAIKEIYAEIQKLTKEKVSSEELETVKNYMVGGFIKSINSPFSLAQLFKTVYFHDLDSGYFNSYVSEVHKVSAEDILNMTQKYLDTNFLEIAVG